MGSNESGTIAKLLSYWKIYIVVVFLILISLSALITLCPVIPLFTGNSCPNWFEIPEMGGEDKRTSFDIVLNVTILDFVDRDKNKIEIPVDYHCTLEGRPPYLRPSNRFHCVHPGQPPNVISAGNFSVGINVTWREVDGDGSSRRSRLYDLTINSGDSNVSTFTEEFYISVPPLDGRYEMALESRDIQGDVNLTVNSTRSTSTPYRIHSYSEVLQYQNQQFQRRTIPFQVLVLILLVFNGFQLLISLFEYGTGQS